MQPTLVLQKGERIEWEQKPKPALRLMWAVIYLPLFYIVSVFLVFWATSMMFAFSETLRENAGAVFFSSSVSGIILGIILSVVFAVLRYDKEYYWITNKRIAASRGLLGYSINSVQYNRIADTIVSRSFLEQIFGITSLQVQTLAGQITHRGRGGAEISFQGLENPEEVQAVIYAFTEKEKSGKL